MADLVLIEQFRAYLVAQGIVLPWGTAGALPQCILDPRDGGPEPTSQGYGGAVLVLQQANHVVRQPLEEFLEEAVVDITARAYRSPDAELLQRRVRNAVNGRELFTMGTLLVEQARVWIGDRPLGSDASSYTRRQGIRFLMRVKALAGLPYA